MTLLEIIQTVTDELALPRPAQIQATNDDQIRQLSALVNREGKELLRRHIWAPLLVEGVLTTVDAQNAYALPTDFDRFVNQTFYDRSQRRQVMGPNTPQEWQWRLSEQVASEFYRQFRIRGTSASNLLIYPTPGTDGQTLYYEYVSKNWGEDDAGTGKETLTLDTDVSRLDADLIVLGTIWRFLRAKGMDYADYTSSYMSRLNTLMAADGGGSPELTMSRKNLNIYEGNIPDGNWPGSGNP